MTHYILSATNIETGNTFQTASTTKLYSVEEARLALAKERSNSDIFFAASPLIQQIERDDAFNNVMNEALTKIEVLTLDEAKLKGIV